MEYNGTCHTNPNKCKSQVALNRLMKDPVLGPFLNSRAISNEDKSSAAKLGGYGWISLPTTAANGTTMTKEKLNKNDESINFLAIKKYDTPDSKKIYDALNNSMRSGAGTGANIIFDEQGNFVYWDGQTNNIFRNPILPPPLKHVGLLTAGSPSTGESGNTIANKLRDHIENTVYYYNKKMIANLNMTYIILTLDTVPSANSIYYLVYNPIHRKKFREYYTHLLGYEGTWVGSNLIKPGNSGGYQNNPVSTVPTSTGGPVTIAPSFIKTAARYCNALKIGSDTLQNGRRAQHYLDPTCTFILSKEDSDMALVTGKNYTQSNLFYDRYAPENGTDADGKRKFITIKRFLLSAPGNSQLHWPCKASWDPSLKTPFKYADDNGLFGDNKTSFVNVLGNAYINNMGIYPSGAAPHALNVGGGNFEAQPKCLARDLAITTCVNHVDVAGDAKGNNIAMSAACGASAPEPEPEPEPESESDEEPDERNNTTVPYTDNTTDNTTVPYTQTTQTTTPRNTTVPYTQTTQTTTPPATDNTTVPYTQTTTPPATDNTVLYIILAFLLILIIIGGFLLFKLS